MRLAVPAKIASARRFLVEKRNLPSIAIGEGTTIMTDVTMKNLLEATVHLRRAQRDLHHRPAADGEDVP
jgi:hypothetical protein